MNRARIPTLVVALLVAGPLHAQERTRLAVLEMASSTRAASVDEVQFLSTIVRTAVVRRVDVGRYHVMTTDEMTTLAPPEAIRCLAQECILKIGKVLQADVVLGGRISDVGGQIAVTLEVYRTQPGGLVANEYLRGKTFDEVTGALEPKVRALVEQLLDRLEGASGRSIPPEPAATSPVPAAARVPDAPLPAPRPVPAGDNAADQAERLTRANLLMAQGLAAFQAGDYRTALDRFREAKRVDTDGRLMLLDDYLDSAARRLDSH